MFRIVQIDHVVLRVKNLQLMLDFYQQVVGCTLERQETDLGLYQLRAGLSLIDLVPVNQPLGQQGGEAPGIEGHNMDHLCLRIEPFDPQALQLYFQHQGVTAGPVESRYGAEGQGPSIYIQDPEGNTIEIKGPPYSIT
ncbi:MULTISPECIES: VOC family protein [Rheinheimera]|jgi:glyoxylase I family protein|uniref:VOC family protein n=1 Tax=Rheinheimera tangshanensis TaxID=400153 RepID=A0A5C8M4D3_9GAMM|nr:MULTISPECIES: VOC family protein [Rheinheimera]KOO56961.1 lactoylglutathione lyase [Rheinheimera sp. KL1]TXK83325.1 VOC family protein [Rheinheimera tangshanensis]GGM44498.1 lactoylglutathione lyase [Rheinheimera tangshanensis]